MNATERTRGIGRRMAVGATPRNVLIQFPVDSVARSMAGGLIAVVLGITAARLLALRFRCPYSSTAQVAFGVVVRMKSIVALSVLMLVGCSARSAQSPAAHDSPLRRMRLDASSEGVELKGHPGLLLVVQAPLPATYDASLFGPIPPSLRMRLTNTSAQATEIEPFHAFFSATRSGVSFSCRDRPLQVSSEHEPRSLAAGASYTFERDLRCTMPLPGHYQVRTYVTVGQAVAPSMTQARAVATFSFDVLPGAHPPTLNPSHPGVFVTMTGSAVLAALPPAAWARGDYRVVIAVINGSGASVPGGSAHITFTTFKRGSSLPCTTGAEPLEFPAQLGPGTIATASAPLTCAPSEEGSYEVVGQLAFANGESELMVGTLALVVRRDPYRLWPGPRLGPSSFEAPLIW